MADEKTPLLHSGSKQPLGVTFSPTSSQSGDQPIALVKVKELFRYSDGTDKILMTLGIIGSVLYGSLTTAQFILMGGLTDDFVDYALWNNNTNSSKPDLEDSMTKVAVWYIAIAVGNFLFAWMGLGLFALSSERQIQKMRLIMFRNIIYQEIGWFDEHSSGEINSRLVEDLNKVADGIGSKFGRLISSVVAFFSGYAIGFVYIWELTLVMLAMFPLIVIVGGTMAQVTGSYTAKELEAYSKAGHIAEQSISSIRTVSAFGGEEKQAELYDEHLAHASKYGVKKGLSIGLGMGAFQVVIYCNYALALWYVVKMTRDGDATAGDGILVFFAVLVGAMTLGQAGPSAEALGVARGAAFVIFNIIDRKSKIDASSYEGLKPANIKGDVDFSHIDFVYPTRKSVRILKDFNLKVPSGKRVALVGESGCGKSTVVKLMQRFYDPVKGSVKLDGQDIKNLNVRHLRSFIGVVNQEPVLFATTIAENISYGREGVTQQEIEEAAKMANAHNFITQFPQGYDTLCGERGAKMSGGQKQRIAIARALVRNPKILLLDEATSALDSESEAVVQDALDKAAQGRTTIIIAHRLSTIKNADIIVAVSDGRIAEMGTHEELMDLNGLYNTLVKLQGKGVDEDDEDYQGDDDSEEDEMAVEIGKDGAFKLGSVVSTMSDYQSKSMQPDDDVDVKSVSLMRILKMNYPEWRYLVIGCLGAALYGGYPPSYGIAFGKMYEAFSYDPSDEVQRDEMKDKARDLAIFYIVVGIGVAIGVFTRVCK